TRALMFASTDDNKSRILDAVDPAAHLAVLESLRDTAWVGGPCSGDCAGWLSANRVWYASEADGFSHLYTIGGDGTGRQQLTKGRWEVRDVDLSPDRRWFYLQTNEVSPFEQHLYRLPTTGGHLATITTKVAKHTTVVSPDGRLVADVYSYVNRPPDLFLLRHAPGAEMSQLTVSPSAEWLSFPWLAPEIVKIPASDGVEVPAHIYRPSDMKAEPNGAAVIFVHGAGYLHNVGNFWSEYPREYMFNQFLASKGYTVLDLDYRGSDGYGRDWRTAIYRHMGGRDLQDQVDASKDIVRLTERFIELGKTRWELAAYPVEDHAFVRPSSWADEYRRIFELFERYLPARNTNKRSITSPASFRAPLPSFGQYSVFRIMIA